MLLTIWKLPCNLKPQTDWQHIWNTVKAVTDDEWIESQQKLREAYQSIRESAQSNTWKDIDEVYGALGILMHNAYHLGEIRQALCTIKSQ